MTNKPRPQLQPGETRAYPVLPLRDIVVFPHMIVPLFVGREKSIKALEEVMRSDTFILLATQKNASDDDPAMRLPISALMPSRAALLVPAGCRTSPMCRVIVLSGPMGRMLSSTVIAGSSRCCHSQD